MIKQTILSILILAMCSCAVFQNTALTQLLVSNAVSLGLAHTPEPPRHQIAVDIEYASSLYNAFINLDGTIDTPDQFAAALFKYLPNDAGKVNAMAILNPLYSTYYAQIAAKSPKTQAMYLSVILNGLAAGSASY